MINKKKSNVRLAVVCSSPNSSGGVGGGCGCGGGGGDVGGCGCGSSSSTSSSSSSSSSSSFRSSISVDSTRKCNINRISICNNNSSCCFCSLLIYFNMHLRLGTSVLVFGHPALPSGCEPSAAASKLSV